MNVCNYKLIWLIIWNSFCNLILIILCWHAIYIFKQHLLHPWPTTSLSARALKISSSKKNIKYLGTCVFLPLIYWIRYTYEKKLIMFHYLQELWTMKGQSPSRFIKFMIKLYGPSSKYLNMIRNKIIANLRVVGLTPSHTVSLLLVQALVSYCPYRLQFLQGWHL